ncbi:hypothetical protein CEXT_36231 [Caerostris extrusa]|uniref:Uncharacterized protein n=1 Tax=Caerostris extrusa TaxID=172846 RepID=A0AAV4MGW7_CAEEX|nr:hypothetical protein CEXT_36231 [Caerostris extrusa]
MVGVVEGWREKVFKVFSLKGFRFAIVLKCCCCSCCSLSLALLQKTVCQFLVSVMRETFCSVWLVFAGCFEKRRDQVYRIFGAGFVCVLHAPTGNGGGGGQGEVFCMMRALKYFVPKLACFCHYFWSFGWGM